MKFLSEFALLNLGNLICTLGLSLIAPFYPTYALKFDVKGSLLGLIFGINPIGGMLSSLIVGKILNNKNQTTLLSLGMLIQSIGLFCFPLLTLTNDRTMFITISLLGRFISGFGASAFLTPLYAAIPQKYPESVDQKMAIAEFFSSFGYLCGPVIGSLLYTLGGFSFPFILFASCSVIIAIILKLNINNNAQKTIVENSEPIINPEYDINYQSESILQNEQLESSIGYTQLIKLFPVVSSLLVMLAVCMTFTFFSPISSLYFEEQFGVPPENVGYYMAAAPLAYSIGAIIISKITFNKQRAILSGMVLVTIAQFFMGPDPLMNIDPQIYITVSAQFIFGLFSAAPYILILPYITQNLEKKFKKSDHEKCISLASGLFNAVISAGECLGPIFSGTLSEFFSYQRACSFLGLYLVATTLFFFPNLFLSKKKSKKSQVKAYEEYL
ncbi:unnamed protein product (macronuclear) [Paramecium tetraurelia]|uniref:Major facilitator superfamily (MFS) profile domain-containing protein n=1 Tax=Paramecium tetraurelia TaxID=5888 RepID=A0BEN4_PARTE|nr:uncharacterized protein GSPATT00028034001 [Paramecium tetraurelia]CAK57001.1 unnamed protein product [Paramecium tetraurelia]|eukprot:XP_001424399.1 hypothetical protein (macronuclear) [Paramecium tetraurelia strain d4-2]